MPRGDPVTEISKIILPFAGFFEWIDGVRVDSLTLYVIVKNTSKKDVQTQSQTTTALGFMGVPYLNTTLGRDILVPRTPERDYAFVRYGLMTDDLFYRSARFGPEFLYAFRSAEPTRPVERPEELAELRWLHETLWEWSLYAMYNNPPRPHVPPTAVSDG